jgi:hypothetical protein
MRIWLLVINVMDVEWFAGRIEKFAPYDESLHSFLIRNQLLHDPETKPVGVISKSGGWLQSPFAHRSVQNIFHNYSDHELLERIDIDIQVDGQENNLFDCPVSYSLCIEKTFFSDREPLKYVSGVGREIRYCIDCISESVEKSGYGYFKFFWDKAAYCLVHSKQLKQLPLLGSKVALDLVKSILRGCDPNEAKTIPQCVVPINSISKNILRNYFFPIKMTDCLKGAFSRWLFRNLDRLSNDFWKYYERQYVSETCLHVMNKSEFYRVATKNLSSIFIILVNSESLLITSFYYEFAGFFSIQIGPRKQGVLKEIISKNGASNCGTCRVKSCPMKQVKDASEVNISSMNLEYILQNSYSLMRVALQFRTLVAVSPVPWGAYNVDPNKQLSVQNQESC